MTTETEINTLAGLHNELLQEKEKRQRNKTIIEPAPTAGAITLEQWEKDISGQEIKALQALMLKIDDAKKKPDPKDLAALRQALIRYPEFCATLGNQAEHVRRRLISELFKLDPIGNEMLQAELENMRAALGYKESPALEKVIIDQITNCYIFHYAQENRYAGMLGAGAMSLDQGKFWEYRLTVSQKRLLRAVEMLARVRKLTGSGPAALQINIAAGQQLNLAK
jgi:hypothetical protein